MVQVQGQTLSAKPLTLKKYINFLVVTPPSISEQPSVPALELLAVIRAGFRLLKARRQVLQLGSHAAETGI